MRKELDFELDKEERETHKLADRSKVGILSEKKGM